MLESLFNRVAGQACNFIKKRLQHRCFPVNIAKRQHFEEYLRTCLEVHLQTDATDFQLTILQKFYLKLGNFYK